MNREDWDAMIKYETFFLEFEWLAIDNKGQLGIFTCIMNAPVPNKVQSSFENYMDLRQIIESTPKTTTAIVETNRKGNFRDWIAYAEQGFFAFDFQDVHRKEKENQYDLIARPTRPLSLDELHIPAELANNLIRIDCDFSDGDVKTEKVK